MEEQPVDGVRRDPMAEMFDLIQNTKQKREAKQLLSAQQASMDALDASKKSPGITRLVAICVAVSIFGLILGQWFQWFSSEPVASPPPPKSAAKTEPVETKAESKSETIDRSTEKMTIRSVVEKKPEVTHSKPATIHSKAPSPAESKRETEAEKESTEEASSPKKGDKDLEELRDLKKELQELKALKEELKNAPLNDEFGEGDLAPYPDNAGGSFGGSTGNYGNPQNYPNPGYNPNSGENPQNPGQPGLSPTPGSDLRY
ncbi:hypothetical protein EBZ37_13250 [bacterium]|nr:hypothetical protein [bacterium]